MTRLRVRGKAGDYGAFSLSVVAEVVGWGDGPGSTEGREGALENSSISSQ